MYTHFGIFGHSFHLFTKCETNSGIFHEHIGPFEYTQQHVFTVHGKYSSLYSLDMQVVSSEISQWNEQKRALPALQL